MKRILTAFGMGASVVALSAGPAIACPSTPTDPNPKYPASKGYYFVNDTVTFPKGYACNVAMRLHIVGHQRTFVNGKLQDPKGNYPPPKPGDRSRNESPDEIFTLTNLKNHHSVTKLISGTLFTRVSANGRDLRIRGVGKNLYNGKGIEGFVYAKGRQWLTVDHAFSDHPTLHLNRTRGTTIELCHRLGARAVPGENLPASSQP